MQNDDLLIVPAPALVTILLAEERKKGSPLSEAEVIEIRDRAACIAVPADVLFKLEEERGYEDIDPKNVWEAWKATRRDVAALHRAGVGHDGF